MVANLRVCTHCGHHFSVTSRERIPQLVDEGSWTEIAAGLRSADPLEFIDSKPYPERLAQARTPPASLDAVLVGTATIGGQRVALSVMDFTFMGGSMGSVVGEKFARAADAAVAERIPLVSVASSGGARMQEGVLALMQMAKTVASVDEVREAALPYISILAHPTTGGVAASFAALGDMIIAEPGALLSFSGPRVVQADHARERARRLRPGRVQPPARPRRPDRAAPRAAERVASAIALLAAVARTARARCRRSPRAAWCAR